MRDVSVNAAIIGVVGISSAVFAVLGGFMLEAAVSSAPARFARFACPTPGDVICQRPDGQCQCFCSAGYCAVFSGNVGQVVTNDDHTCNSTPFGACVFGWGLCIDGNDIDCLGGTLYPETTCREISGSPLIDGRRLGACYYAADGVCLRYINGTCLSPNTFAGIDTFCEPGCAFPGGAPPP